jgi:AcrR family transcriptional regulator
LTAGDSGRVHHRGGVLQLKGKDDRFLAVLDAGARRRFPLHTELIRLAPSIEDGPRASAREMVQYARDHPGWTGVYVGGLVAGWAARWGVEFRLPTREVVRGIYAISRGMGLEALLADEPDSTEQFEEMFLAYAMGMTRARTGTGAPGEGRLP